MEKSILLLTLSSALRQRELELKSEFKNYKFSEGLNVKEKLNQNKSNLCKYNSHKKGRPQNLRFKDKNKNQLKSKNQVKKCYDYGKAYKNLL